MSFSLDDVFWTTVSGSDETQRRTASLVRGKIASATWWPLLSHATSERDFENRLQLVAERIEASVDPDVYDSVIESLRDDYRAVTAASESEQCDSNFAAGKRCTKEKGHEGDHGAPWTKKKESSLNTDDEIFNASTGKWEKVSAYHEQYGEVSRPQLAAYRKHNVPPALHDELAGYFGSENHAAITNYVNQAGARNGRLDYGDVYRHKPSASGHLGELEEGSGGWGHFGAAGKIAAWPGDAFDGGPFNTGLTGHEDYLMGHRDGQSDREVENVYGYPSSHHMATNYQPDPAAGWRYHYPNLNGPVNNGDLQDADGFVVDLAQGEDRSNPVIEQRQLTPGTWTEHDAMPERPMPQGVARGYQPVASYNPPLGNNRETDHYQQAKDYHTGWHYGYTGDRHPEDTSGREPGHRTRKLDNEFNFGYWDGKEYHGEHTGSLRVDQEGFLVEALVDPAPGTPQKVNPFYFGDDTAMGENAGFPQQPQQDPTDRVNEIYGEVPPQTSSGSEQGTVDGKGYSRSHPGESPDFSRGAGERAANYQYIKQQGGKWVITQKGTGKVLSHHDSEEEAEASFRAMMQSKHGGYHDTSPDPRVDGEPWYPEPDRPDLSDVNRAPVRGPVDPAWSKAPEHGGWTDDDPWNEKKAGRHSAPNEVVGLDHDRYPTSAEVQQVLSQNRFAVTHMTDRDHGLAHGLLGLDPIRRHDAEYMDSYRRGTTARQKTGSHRVAYDEDTRQADADAERFDNHMEWQHLSGEHGGEPHPHCWVCQQGHGKQAALGDNGRCNCEHAEHYGENAVGDSYPKKGHDPQMAPAGKYRAWGVGPICDRCAMGHMNSYLLGKSGSTDGKIVDHCPGCSQPRRLHSTMHGDEIRHLHNDHVRCHGDRTAKVKKSAAVPYPNSTILHPEHEGDPYHVTCADGNCGVVANHPDYNIAHAMAEDHSTQHWIRAHDDKYGQGAHEREFPWLYQGSMTPGSAVGSDEDHEDDDDLQSEASLSPFFDPYEAQLSNGSVHTADYLGRPDANNPTGRGPDEYRARNWDAYSRQRPMQSPDARNVNTPVLPQEHMQTKNVNTPTPGLKDGLQVTRDEDKDEDDDE